MDTQSINIVSRLYNMIEKIKNSSQQDPYKALAYTFKVDINDKISIFQKYTDLLAMAAEGKNKIKRMNINKKDKYIKAIDDTIEGLLKIDLNDKYNGITMFRRHFEDKVLIPLEFCAECISNFCDEKLIDDEEIKILLEEINNLMEQVLHMEINKDLKHICMYNLEKIHETILNYKLVGNEGLTKNLESSLGSLALNSDKVKNNMDKNLFNTVCNLINKINMLLTSGNKSMDLIETFTKNLKRIC